MSKRKRSASKETTSDTTAEGEPSVHVSPDVLAGSPDVFAPGKDKPAETPEPEAMTADVPTEAAAPETVTEAPAIQAEEPTPAAAAVVEAAPPPPPSSAAYQPHAPAYDAPSQPSHRAGSSGAFGVVLVDLGLFALLVPFTGFDAGRSLPPVLTIPVVI